MISHLPAVGPPLDTTHAKTPSCTEGKKSSFQQIWRSWEGYFCKNPMFLAPIDVLYFILAEDILTKPLVFCWSLE